MKALTTLTLLALAAAGCSDQLVGPNLEGTEHLPTPAPAFAKQAGQQRIVFQRDDDVFVMDANGLNQNQVTFLHADADPALSPVRP